MIHDFLWSDALYKPCLRWWIRMTEPDYDNWKYVFSRSVYSDISVVCSGRKWNWIQCHWKMAFASWCCMVYDKKIERFDKRRLLHIPDLVHQLRMDWSHWLAKSSICRALHADLKWNVPLLVRCYFTKCTFPNIHPSFKELY